MSTTLTDSGTTVMFTDYPNRGILPTINRSGLNFLPSNISHACVCVGSFGDGTSPMKTHWLGKNALSSQQFLSTTKFIGVLNAIEQINSRFPTVDIDDCVIESPKRKFLDLLIDMVSYEREDLEEWLRQRTGDTNSEFRGGYGASFPSLIANPIVKDLRSDATVLSSTSRGNTGNNLVSAYDLVRLISMLGWHLHLNSNTRFFGSQWKSLETVVRGMGTDPARYIDVALETLGVINLISQPVIISKVGFGISSYTYAAFVKFVDNRVSPAKLRTFALALRTPDTGGGEKRDTNLAVAVTEIVRRILTEELA